MATKVELLAEAQARGLNADEDTSYNDLRAMLKADDEAHDGDDGDGDDLEVDTSSVQKAFDAEQERGFRGTKVDPTPNSAYTVAGVTAGEPTPETDPELRAQARARAFNDVGGGQSEITAEREPGEGE